MVSDETIERVLAERRDDLDAAVAELVRLANKAGGEDNITVVAFEVGERPAEPEERTVEQTRPLPALSDDGEDPTLHDAPAVDTMVVSGAEAEELRRAATEKPRRPREASIWPLAWLILMIAIAAVVLWLVVR
jgi:hypothetical protein